MARASRRITIETAVFHGATLLTGDGGTVLVEHEAGPGAPIGGRTVRVRRLDDRLYDLLAGGIECVGVGHGITLDVDVLRARGVSRICPVGRLQRPRIDWPRGQRPPVASLFRAPGEPRIQVES